MTRVMEEWRPVIGFETHYEVSNMGNVRSIDRLLKNRNGFTLMPGRRLKPRCNRGGYLMVALSKDNKVKACTIHRLVAAAFHGSSDLTVNHRNHDKLDNRAENLEYMTFAENYEDMISADLNVKGESHHRAKLTEEKVRLMRRLRSEGVKLAALAKRFQVTETMVSLIVRRKNWTHIE